MKVISLKGVMGGVALGTALFVTSVQARPSDSIHSLVWDIGRSTDSVLRHLQDDLIYHGRWKPRGYDAKLWSSLAKLEEYGDSMDKAYHRYGPRGVHEVSLAMAKQLAGVHYWMRHTHVPRAVHHELRAVEHALAAVERLTHGHYRRGREFHGDDYGDHWRGDRRWHRDGRRRDGGHYSAIGRRFFR